MHRMRCDIQGGGATISKGLENVIVGLEGRPLGACLHDTRVPLLYSDTVYRHQ